MSATIRVAEQIEITRVPGPRVFVRIGWHTAPADPDALDAPFHWAMGSHSFEYKTIEEAVNNIPRLLRLLEGQV